VDWLHLGIVFGAALITALATGLGALPFLLVPRMSRRWLGASNALAAGLMIAASLTLIVEGAQESQGRLAIGLLLGYLAMRVGRRFMHRHGEFALGELRGADAKKALLIVGVMTLHSFTEGLGVGVSFGGGEGLGVFISAAIAVHNVPEGLAISLVLVPRGVSPWTAAGWSVFSSLPQPLMAVPAYLFVTAFTPLLPVGFGLAAGAMLWMTVSELLPEARVTLGRVGVLVAVIVSAVAMIAFQETLLR